MRFRLIKPDWATELAGPSTLEGEFEVDFVKEKNTEGYNVYFFPNHNSYPLDKKFLSGKDIDHFTKVFVDMDLKDGKYASKEEFMALRMIFLYKVKHIISTSH